MKNARQPDDERTQEAARLADEALSFVMGDPRGRRFVWGELGRNGLMRQTYSPNNSEQCFAAGQRNAAILLLNDVMRLCPEQYLAMQNEAIEAARREAELEAARAAENEGDNDD